MEENHNGIPYGLHGGKPSDTMDQMGRGKVLERLVSPTVLDNLRATMKGKNAADGGDNISYAAIAAKSISTDGNSPKVFSFTYEEVEVLDEECLVDESGAFSMIKFSDKVHEKIDKSMHNALLNRMHSMWRSLCEIQLIDLDKKYYFFRFANARDYSMVLTDDQWTIYGSYLTVQPWSRSFSTSEEAHFPWVLPERIVIQEIGSVPMNTNTIHEKINEGRGMHKGKVSSSMRRILSLIGYNC
ncbi:hypothetical protein GQ457_01G024170 [Hibiscus cannabinus]